ncbi:antitoxin MazE-like protein [Polynucleobacter arcticus]|uniref:Uncharacterized protein n=1 Tax=Polynucleobacter arcticus TaxID=1743165 RepID=A0A6M9PK92_9BURK|nr:hypothetical protein DN92_00705 [Polynucleobacter arcticus]
MRPNMSSNLPKIALNPGVNSIEFTEECRYQSALATLADRSNSDLTNFLDQALLDLEERQ